jgi:OmpA-OmpF porin, OOP family
MRFHILIVLTAFSTVAAAQNLVLNPSFELNKKIPKAYCRNAAEFADYLESWNTPNRASSDYFHRNGKNTASLDNMAGKQEPQDGDAYAGIYTSQEKGSNYREYLQVPLTEPLKKGKNYTIRFYVSLGEISSEAIDRIGVLFSKKKIQQQDYKVLEVPASAETEVGVFFDDKIRWMPIVLNYTAKGGERFLVIGNFHLPRETHFKPVEAKKKKHSQLEGSYYFIDNVCVSASETSMETCPCVLADCLSEINPSEDTNIVTVLPPGMEQSQVLATALFDTDKAILQSVAFPALDSLADFLAANPQYAITISGHTDSSGDEAHNRELSEQRANAVKDYLVSKGIAAGRITAEGFGSSVPVADNETPEGRAMNRRVEYYLLKY